MKNRIYLYICCCLFALQLGAQDVHFSQFELSPMQFNPSLTGVSTALHRVTAHYRSQWQPALKELAYNSYSLSYEHQKAIGRMDYWGMGGFARRDKAGDLNFGAMEFQLSSSYIRQVGGNRPKKHYMSVGFGIGSLQYQFDQENIQWADSYDPGSNRFLTGATQEQWANNNELVMSLSTGLSWWSIFDERTSFYVSIGVDHVNRPQYSLYSGGTNDLPVKLSVLLGGEFKVTRKLSIVPSVLFFKQASLQQLNIGGSTRIIMEKLKPFSQAIQLGLNARISNRLTNGKHLDALIAKFRLELQSGLQLGFSYDINASNTAFGNQHNNALELTANWQFGTKKRRRLFCPVF